MSRDSILQLEKDLLIGQGNVRAVYRHPDDPGKCVKITINPKRRRAAHREIIYLRLYRLLGKSTFHLSHYFGKVETSLGTGALYSLCRDYNGAISRPLSHHIFNEIPRPLPPERICALLLQLYRHLLQEQIIISDPAPQNLMVKFSQPDKPRLILVDGIGNSNFLKIADFSRYWGSLRIAKKWRYYVTDNIHLKETFQQAGIDPETYFHSTMPATRTSLALAFPCLNWIMECSAGLL